MFAGSFIVICSECGELRKDHGGPFFDEAEADARANLHDIATANDVDRHVVVCTYVPFAESSNTTSAVPVARTRNR